MRRGTTKRCWPRCGRRCCQPCRNTVPWWRGLWTIPVFPSRGSIPWVSLGSNAVNSAKQDNCQAAVSLSVSTWGASLPIAWRLYLPQVWCQDSARCQQAGVPEEIAFQTKPEIALQQIRQAKLRRTPPDCEIRPRGSVPHSAAAVFHLVSYLSFMPSYCKRTTRALIAIRVFLRLTAMDVCCGPPASLSLQ
jgi:hypothetical protein